MMVYHLIYCTCERQLLAVSSADARAIASDRLDNVARSTIPIECEIARAY